MKYFRQLQNRDVTELVRQLASTPELWDVDSHRTATAGSPHYGCSDIWLRYNAREKLGDDYKAWTGPHDSVWHAAYYALPALRPLIFEVMREVEATRLGGCLITHIPAGQQVRPHTDLGWHPEHYNTKVYLPLEDNDYCVNYTGDESLVMKVGEAWVMTNTVEHSVVNGGVSARKTLILSTRTEA